ncbi:MULTISPECIES: hypothetical protein [Pseudarthrobacter]|uniref:hypothetical protein n=1 Tax=Pseudarthrobacter TaxID=1742993 RepID=UPI0013DD0436|nr:MULTISPECIES: hypothetical protein [Pseudarthrobacter]MDQ0000106.1 hypothetical protein [Pseudarthrobacter sulfonivorans]
MNDKIEIRRGDVLLFHGTDIISWAIRTFDGTDVNHAAIALDEATLMEAAARGLRHATIEAEVSGSRYVRVRRHTEDDLASVVATAASHVKRRAPYAYQQIVMLALLAATRTIPLGGTGRRMVRSILDHAAAALNAFVDRDGTRSMICSEFVYRAFAEAPSDPAERFRLLIHSGDIAFGEVEPCLAEWALQQSAETYEAAFRIPVSFDVTAAQPDEAGEAAEEELAPLIVAWAEDHNLVTEDMPPAPPPSFEVGESDDPTDEELLASMVSFSTALTNDSEFGIGTTLGVAAALGAIQGLLTPAIEANFVTPGDLLKSPTLVDIGRIDGLG